MRSIVDNESGKTLLKVVNNVFGFITVLMALVVWSKYAKTAERGFLCSDETIKANFHGETVSFLLLMTVSILVPIMMVILVESNLRRQTNPEQYEFFGITIPAFIAVIGHYVSFFFIGFTLNLLITQIGKYTVGRYRPHFYTSCMPVFEDSTNCSHPINAGRYIDVYTCTNPELTEFELTDLRQSFPSGHASISFYSMTFVAVYLFFRRGFLRNFNSIKLSAELLFVSFALVAGLSRVGDNRHHWTDVMFGAILGSMLSTFTILQSNLFRKVEDLALPTVTKSRHESVETLRL